MAWEGSTRRARLPDDWPVRRLRVLRRDGYRCQVRDELGVLCGEPGNEVDHISPGDDHGYDNLQTICRWHHGRKTAAEGNAARRRVSRARPAESHPGML
ncbi:hypothetical protein GCM10023317_05160 [Actinopolymorpha pittospori]